MRLNGLPTAAAKLQDEKASIEDRRAAAKALREALSAQDIAPMLNACVDSGVSDWLLEILKKDEVDPVLQAEVGVKCCGPR